MLFVGTTVEVVAQTLEVTTDPANPIYYTIKNFRSQNYATYQGTSTQLGQKNSLSSASYWYFMANGEGFSIISAANPEVKLATNASFTADGAVWYIKENPHNSGTWCISLNSDLSGNCWDDANSHTAVGYWAPSGGDYEGTSWTFDQANYTFDQMQELIAQEKAYQMEPSFENGLVVTVGEKVSSISPVTDAADNTKWYVITQIRGGETPMYNVGIGSQMKRTSTGFTVENINNQLVADRMQYLVRFIETGDNTGLYHMQFADGSFINSSLSTSANRTDAAPYAFYNSNGGNGSYFGWNLNSNTGSIVDNNAAGNTVAFWSSGTVSGTEDNNVWGVYETTIDAPAYTITYIVQDTNGTPLFTSEPAPTTLGTTITTLPEEFQRSAFYTYDNVNVTISESGNTDAVFTATLKEDAPVNFTADTTDPIYYNLNIRSSYLVYNTRATGEVTLQETSEPFNPNASWAFIGNPYDGFKVINKAKTPDYNLTYTSVVTATHSNNNIQFVAAADAAQKLWIIENNTNGFVLRMKENTSIYFHHDSQGNFLRTCSYGEYPAVHNDAGSTIVKSSDDEALEAIYNSMKDMEFGEHLGQYSLAEGKTSEDAQNLIAAVGQDVDSKNTGKYAEDYEALKALNAVLNMPKDGQFLRIKATVGEKPYLQAANAEGTMTFSENTDGASPIFCYYNGKLLAYQNGVAVKNMNQMSAIGGESSDINFKAGIDGSTSTYSLYTMINKYEYYLKSTGVNGENADKNPVNNIEENPKNTFTLEEVTTLPVKMNIVDDKSYATFSAPVGVTGVENADIYSIAIEGNQAVYTEIEGGQAPAETGLLLIGEASTTEATITLGDVDATVETEMKPQIVCIEAATAKEENKLFLGTKSGKLGFYNLKSDGGKSGGFKAYIENPAAADGEAKGLILVADGDVTAIDNLQFTNDNSAIYDLQGRLVNGKLPKGVFIQNGKKVVVK